MHGGLLTILTTMDQVNFWMTSWRSRGRMNVQAAEVPSELESICYIKIGEILLTKGYVVISTVLLGHTE